MAAKKPTGLNSNMSELLEKLHDGVGKLLLKRIESGEATPQEIACAIKFLNDNGVDVQGRENKKLQNLNVAVTNNLPFSAPEDEAKGEPVKVPPKVKVRVVDVPFAHDGD